MRNRIALTLVAMITLCSGSILAQDAEEAPGFKRGQATIGKYTFRSFCSSCHGYEGRGDGSLADMLRVRPADLTRIAHDNGGEFPAERVRAIIDGREDVKGHGTSDMPAWGDAFQAVAGSEEAVQKKIDQLVYFIESIQAEPTDEE